MKSPYSPFAWLLLSEIAAEPWASTLRRRAYRELGASGIAVAKRAGLLQVRR